MSSASRSRSKTKKEPPAITGEVAGSSRGENSPAMDTMSQKQNLRTVTGRALAKRWRKLARQTKEARSNPTEKSVHDLRVAIRRMVAVLDVVKAILPKSGTAKVRKQLKTHLNSLSTLRDTQVQILQVKQLLTDHSVLEAFLDMLNAREAAQTRQARKEIDRIDLDSIEHFIRQLGKRLDDFLSSPAVLETSRLILLGMLARTYVRTVALRNEIMSDRNRKIEKIHELRLLFKRFRYIVEVLQPIFIHVSDYLLKQMSEYQSGMGAIQDTEVLASGIYSHAKRSRKMERSRISSGPDAFAIVQDRLASQLKEEADAFLKKMDELDEYWEHIK